MISIVSANKKPAMLKIKEMIDVINEIIKPITNKKDRMPMMAKINISIIATLRAKNQPEEFNH